jgi:hypothetical protein
MTDQQENKMANNGNHGNMVLLGVGIGAAALGVAFALSHRKRDRWSTARQMSRRVVDHTGDMAAASKDILDRIRIIYGESRKVVEEATELLSSGRKLVGV